MDISDKAQRDWLHPADGADPQPPAAHAGRAARRSCSSSSPPRSSSSSCIARSSAQKRFSLEGGEALIPLLNTLIDDGATLGVEEVVMGMAHRGRLNVLAHVLNKPYEVDLRRIRRARSCTAGDEGDGDVKYHLGYANERR